MHDTSLYLRPLAADDVDAVSALARTVWQATYPALISQGGPNDCSSYIPLGVPS